MNLHADKFTGFSLGKKSRVAKGEGAGGGYPSCPARGYGGVLGAPPWGSGAEPQKFLQF